QLVAGRIRGVDRDVLRQQRRGFPADGTPLSVGARHLRLSQPGGQEHGLRGWAEQAGLGRRRRAGRARARDRQGQREERNETQTTSGREREPQATRLRRAGGAPRPSRHRGQCTVIVAWPVLPSLVACSSAFPTRRPRPTTAVPYEVSMTNAESVENQETGRPVNTLPTESRRTLVNPMVSPTARLALDGCTVTLATDAAVPV